MQLQRHNKEKGHVYCPITALLLVIFSMLYFNDEICEEKVTDSLMSSRVSSPETNELFEGTVSEDGDLSPNTSKVFDVTFEDHERDQKQVHGFEPLPSEHDDIGCTPLADSDNEVDTMTSKLPYICCDSLMKAFLND